MGSLVLTQGQSSLTLSTTMSPKIQILPSMTFCLSCLLTGTGATLQPEPEEVSLSGVYGFFTNELVIRRFYVGLIFQLLFTSAGWLLAHEIYRVYNPSVSTETNLEELSNFVLSDQNSVGGAGIGIGYGIASSLFWLGLAQLGNPSSKKRSSDTEQSRLASQGWLPHSDLKRQGEEREEISLTEDVLPSLLARNSVLQQILINTVLVRPYITILINKVA